MSEYCNYLYPDSSYVDGAAQAFDLFGVLDYTNATPSALTADALASFADWRCVGLDLVGGIEAFEREADRVR